jgi:hypothetical protein
MNSHMDCSQCIAAVSNTAISILVHESQTWRLFNHIVWVFIKASNTYMQIVLIKGSTNLSVNQQLL